MLNGLRPELSTYVTQRQPENMAELLQEARIAELTLPASKDTELHSKLDRYEWVVLAYNWLCCA